MADKLNNVVRNRQQSTGGECESILGSEFELVRASDLYLHNADLIQLITTASIVKFCEENGFDKNEFEAFKLGAGSIGVFLQKSFKELQAKNLKKEAEKKKTIDNSK